MVRGRNITADRLIEVFEMARTSKRSGLLSVEHLLRKKVEEGEIYFQMGQPTYAHTGLSFGREAIEWMLNWRTVYFTFVVNVSHPSMQLSTPAYTVSKSGLIRVSQEPSSKYSVKETRFSSWDWKPQKRTIECDVLSLPLTRKQRQILLLVDGRRTITDIARCSNKDSFEIECILRQLQDQGFLTTHS